MLEISQLLLINCYSDSTLAYIYINTQNGNVSKDPLKKLKSIKTL